MPIDVRVGIRELADATDKNEVGGKARGLADLIAHDLPVPPGFVVTVSAFTAVAGSAFARAAAIAAAVDVTDAAALQTAGQAARAAIAEVPLPEDLVAELGRHLAECCPDNQPVAVRSSAVGEDGATTSFAGEHDSFLGISGLDELVDAVRNCWASLFSDRAIAYRARAGLDPTPMAVVVQRLVQAEAAGVIMTLNPATGDRSLIVVESVWGLAEPLVSGAATPDRFRIDVITGRVRARELADKPTREVFQDGGVHTVDTPAELVQAASLSDETLAEIHRHAAALQRCAGGPADAEFAFDGTLWMVQVRPETYWSQQVGAPTARSTMDAILSAITTKR